MRSHVATVISQDGYVVMSQDGYSVMPHHGHNLISEDGYTDVSEWLRCMSPHGYVMSQDGNTVSLWLHGDVSSLLHCDVSR